MNTFHPYKRFVLPVLMLAFAVVNSAQAQFAGGDGRGDYRLRITPEQPQEKIAGYESGWQLVSFPFNPENQPFANWLSHFVANSVYSFEHPAYQVAGQPSAGHGYWVYFTDNDTLRAPEELLESVDRQLDEGWNLIGSIGEEYPAAALFALSQVIDGTLYNDRFETVDAIKPGRGYWIRTNASGLVSLQPDQTGKLLADAGEASDFASFDPARSFYRIALQYDSPRAHRNLFLAGDLPAQWHPENHSLPPKPPAGVFDARFNGDYRLSQDLTATIELESVAWPLALSIIAPGEPGPGSYAEESFTREIDSSHVADTHQPAYDIRSWKVDAYSGEKFVESRSVVTGEPLTLDNNDIDRLVITASEVTGLDDEPGIPEHFDLRQNYPNPFNPATIIVYELAEEVHTTLEIFDIQGRRVEVLVDEVRPAGRHETTWDAGEMSSGIYLYRLQAGSYSQTRRMMFIK